MALYRYSSFPFLYTAGCVSERLTCSELYKELADLRGHRWAALDKESLCGKPTVLSEVKKIGYNASFFGNIVSSGDCSAA